MSRVVLLATVALMLGSGIAEAQDRSRPGGGGRPGASNKLPPGMNRPGRPPGNGGPSVQPPRPGRPEIQPPRPGRPDRPRPPHGNGDYRPPHNRPPHNRPPNYRPPHHGGGHYRPPAYYRPPPGYWNGNVWGRPPIFAPAFRYPYGYSYRRWDIGLVLPAILLSTAYYYSDYETVGLYPAPYGTRWVRYGPDLLLVEEGTRRIVEVRYGVFRY